MTKLHPTTPANSIFSNCPLHVTVRAVQIPRWSIQPKTAGDSGCWETDAQQHPLISECEKPPALRFNSPHLVKCVIEKKGLESNKDEQVPGTLRRSTEEPLSWWQRYWAEAKGGSKETRGLSAPVMGSEALLLPEPTSTEFTSFCSGGLPCGRGQAAVTPSSSSNPGTGNSEAENRSLLTAESVTRWDFGTKAGNGGSSLAPRRETKKKTWDRFTFHVSTFVLTSR